MTPGYKTRRDAKHAAQLQERGIAIRTSVFQTIDLTPRLSPLAFIGLKTQKRADGGRKNHSGHSAEHKRAKLDNAIYDTVQSESKSIGEVNENLGLPSDNADPVSV